MNGNYDIIQWNIDGKMKYSLEELQHDFRKGKNNKYIFFWGHQPSSNGEVTKSCFSQWWKSDFSFCTNRYCCMEQYMMAEKARLFKDDEILEEIMKETNPKIIKALGRKIKNFDEKIWEKNRSAIILNGNLAKFLQNDELKQFLLNTKDRVIVEASPYDKIWGIGMPADDKKIENPLEWKGLNLLGFALMEVRDEVRRICANEEILNEKAMGNEVDLDE